tara:strand:- start:671 stop:1570 length:900 start_codon:yes stop_codon:yes gene_type:complete
MRCLTNIILAVILITSLQGCVIGPRSSASQGLSQILEPVTDSLVSINKEPLIFPATIAILMIPSPDTNMVPNSTLRLAAEELKQKLLENEKYINGVIVVSNSDIQEKITLKTLRNMYGVDIVAIISYQQDQRSSRNSFLSFLDIAIVPAYTIPSVKVTTSTVVDGKIVHIPSNAIIFRASGLNERSTHMTPVSSQENGTNEESIEGLKASIVDLGGNVSHILSGLSEFDLSNAVSVDDVIEDSKNSEDGSTLEGESWEKVDNYKRSGGGSIDLIGLLALGIVFVRVKKYSKKYKGVQSI